MMDACNVRVCPCVQDMRAANAALAQQQQQQQQQQQIGGSAGTAAALHPVHPPQLLSVEVKRLPMHVCALDKSTFVLPARGAAASQARWVPQGICARGGPRG